jgi:uncharacterized coiled-coil protein SlyX
MLGYTLEEIAGPGHIHVRVPSNERSQPLKHRQAAENRIAPLESQAAAQDGSAVDAVLEATALTVAAIWVSLRHQRAKAHGDTRRVVAESGASSPRFFPFSGSPTAVAQGVAMPCFPVSTGMIRAGPDHRRLSDGSMRELQLRFEERRVSSWSGRGHALPPGRRQPFPP